MSLSQERLISCGIQSQSPAEDHLAGIGSTQIFTQPWTPGLLSPEGHTPMPLPRETVLKVAHLARLQLSADEVDALTTQMSSILEYVAMLDEVDVTNVEPMVHAIELTNITRPDVQKPSLPRTDALANAPKTDGKYFLVPSILES